MALTDSDKLNLTKALAGGGSDVTDALAASYLNVAKDKILAMRNPFSSDPSEEAWEARYDTLQCEFAADMINRRGTEGELTNTENGVTRKFASDGVSPSLVRRVVPKGRPL
jgi:hypothetical protein